MIGFIQIVIVGVAALYVLRDTSAGRSALSALPESIQSTIYGAADALPDITLIAGTNAKLDAQTVATTIEAIKRDYNFTANLSTPIVMGLIRQESNLDAGALAYAANSIGSRARGLMQLMPATAYEVIDKYNLGIPHELEEIHYPYNNLLIGMHYLAFLMKRYGNNISSALEAYRMGYGAFDKGARSPEGYANRVLAFANQYAGQGYA